MVEMEQTSAEPRIIDEVKTTPYSWFVATLVLLTYAAIFLCGMVWSTAIPVAYESLGFTMTAAGGLMTASFIGSFVSSLFLSFLADKLGGRLSMALAGILTALFTLVFPFVPGGYWMMFVLRVLGGVAGGTIFASMIKYQQSYFSPATRATAFGYMTSAMPLGAALAAAAMGPIVAADWKNGFVVAAIAALIITVIFYAFAKDKVRQAALPAEVKAPKANATDWRATLAIVKKRSFIIGLIAFFFAIGQGVGFNTYAISYFVMARGFSLETAGLLFGGTTLLGLVAGLAAGGAADLLKNKKLTCYIGTVVSVISTILIMTLSDMFMLTVVLALRSLFGAFMSNPLSALMAEISRGPNEGAAMGVYNAASTAGSVVSPILFGMMLDMTGNNYSIMIVSIVAACAICGILIVFVEEKRPAKAVKAAS
jgi:DHA1 family multidrug resistance protein-like MFS transporter